MTNLVSPVTLNEVIGHELIPCNSNEGLKLGCGLQTKKALKSNVGTGINECSWISFTVVFWKLMSAFQVSGREVETTDYPST